MKKSELIDRVAMATGLSKAQARKVVDAFIETIRNALKAGKTVSIPGFGEFVVRDRAARSGRNPQTGDVIDIKKSRMPGFKSKMSLGLAAPDLKINNMPGRTDEVQDIAMASRVFTGQMDYFAPSPNYAVVNVFFATDREQNNTDDIKSMFGANRGALKYGTVKISIPRDHRMGELEARSVWRLEFRDDPEKHVVMLDIDVIDKSNYYDAIAKKVMGAADKSAFIFFHGYNVTFEDAARRTAQISYDLGFAGAPVFYSWPSHGDKAKYPFDEDNIQWSQYNIENFLYEFMENSKADNVFLIAHSMGTRALTRAYISVLNNKPELKSRFTEVILAAPDIDADVFRRDIAPAMMKIGQPITLYASSEDIPLKASKVFHGGHARAGDSGNNLIIYPGVESIDSTEVETGFLGHSYFSDTRSIISDMYYIFNQRLRANKRAGLSEVINANGIYWKFKK